MNDKSSSSSSASTESLSPSSSAITSSSSPASDVARRQADNGGSSGGEEGDKQTYTLKQVNAAKLITRILPFLGVFVMFWCIYSQMAVGFQNQGCQMDLSLTPGAASSGGECSNGVME